ncbi:hypothetical protein CPG37_08725 [Malaciobacter canalis]|uniref:DUF1641 domain-containing protein n=1 Tax=Malaciobacter canalis TaxID=1912871 RepID=A0ABX4LTQ5_9BACT|nr:DUF1641 domain-containing protein [Malaciobacter canalis]PHO09576.1 hypothetical protein CPG37_08725 [Malaciobacter canalis]QEE31642.1 DUF1641 domain-containing protein [Malaciobacter canalis]
MSEKVEVLKTEEMEKLEEKFSMLIKTGRIDNLIDLLAVISDNIEMTTAPMVDKMIGTVDNLATAGFVTENAVRYANREMKKNEVPSLFGLLKLLKDEETRKGLAFVLHLTKGIGKQV